MPATTPSHGVRKVAVVMARLMVDNSDRGLRWFIVPICDEQAMHPGVVSKRLPIRSGADPLDFSLTRFENILLPEGAMLGHSLEAPLAPRKAWWDEVWRLSVGSMAVAAPSLQSIKIAAFIGAKYSSHRTVLGKDSTPVPILSFPTQQWPILYGVAISFVLDAWYRDCARLIHGGKLDPRVRHGIAIIVKTVLCRQVHHTIEEICERLGTQGLFETNVLARMLVRNLPHKRAEQQWISTLR